MRRNSMVIPLILAGIALVVVGLFCSRSLVSVSGALVVLTGLAVD